LKENSDFGYHNLFILPYSFNKKFETSIMRYIINNYQKINRFLNYEEYVSKSLLYINYKKMKDIFHSEFDYMLESYSYPEDKEIIKKKLLIILSIIVLKITTGY